MEAEAENSPGFAAVLLNLVVLALLIVLVDLVRDRVAGLRRYSVSPALLGVGVLPPGLEDRDDVILDAGAVLDRPRSILDPELPAMAAQALASRPWVRKVSGIRRRFPNTLEIAVEMREPVGVVVAGDERLAIDAAGVVIESESRLGAPSLPEIRLLGTALHRVPVAGQPFGKPPGQSGHDAVLEALAVLNDLRLHGSHRALESVRVVGVRVGGAGRDRQAGEPDIRLTLDSGVEIHWGRASIAPLARLEPGPGEKLDGLLMMMRAYPGLLGIAEVDLHFASPEAVLVR